MDEVQGSVDERGLLTASDEAWSQAVRAAAVIGPLAALPRVGRSQVDDAAAALGVSYRQVYVLLNRWREGGGLVSGLLPARSSGGRGRTRLPDAVEAIVIAAIRKGFLTRQKRSVAAVHRDIIAVCRAQGLPLPSRTTVERRIAQLDPVERVTRRQGPDAGRSRLSAAGRVPPVQRPLDQVQIDHTVVDLIVVDERHRLPIGRPYVTVAIDVFSRCLVGLVVTLEAPSALSVGLCLAHMVTDKRAWLERVGASVVWPMTGKPVELYLDNATEFHSEALKRGCEQHGVKLRYRPPGQPHYGGIVERVIGTMMQSVHDLPGTTFSNPRERGSYDSEKRATLTLQELERWFALAVGAYHGQVHRGLGQTPSGRWKAGVGVSGEPVTVTYAAAFLIDFLPVIRRTVTRAGFTIDHIQYFSDVLKPWIATREKLGRFVIRRDPRDISRIWVLDPDGGTYVMVPYRRMSRPPVSVWEQRAAITQMRAAGRQEVDEESLFRTIGQMREVINAAAASTKRARRTVQRRTDIPVAQRTDSSPPTVSSDQGGVVTPYAEIEEW
uniref:Mu transposase C-terminal domain-containing protein n=1 Tax=Arthrobacter agilis TaxID=37921 RepID=UPI0027D813A1|nr:Mu transposase C-terminal domain-containing protein [Arthrobacter agilis]